MLQRTIFAPHPPVLIPSIGKDSTKKVSKTIEALNKLNEDILKDPPETFVVMSPHGPHSSTGLPILAAPSLEGNFGNFGDPSTIMSFNNDPYMIPMIEERLSKEGFKLDQLNDPILDHGTIVPLHFLANGLSDVKLIPLGYFEADRETNFKIGKILGKAFEEADVKITFIASGDLSHRLSKEAPDGFSPKAKHFDEKLLELIKNKDSQGIVNLEQSLVEEAGQCGLNSLVTLMGILENFDYKPEVLSYEAPFGVGYLTTNFELLKKA